ncbi:MAG: hypothetical protein H6624_02545 [Bdellovibrionaceae bacterium]|nr:hypothetical protein [Pseudobdellovibrionaceae bacterium]
MKSLSYSGWTGLLSLLIFLFGLTAQATIQQRLEVGLDPGAGRLAASVELIPNDESGSIEFWLNSGLQVSASDPLTRIKALGRRGHATQYLATFPSQGSLKFSYQGSLSADEVNPLSAVGVALMGQHHWYPQVENESYVFELTTRSPKSWLVLSHDELLAEQEVGDEIITTWRSTSPQEDIYLMANQWHRFSREQDGIVHRVYLLQLDQQLADRYLDSTSQFIPMYSQLIGAYPYKQMATVENYWETGYGMPSFTLLGPTVIRFPFIFYSSFPHEILHNWWGNGVYVDLSMGNWCEGLTSYMADHFLQEQRGGGSSYRRTALLNFSVFASSGSDFPLKDFVSRHDKSSSAVGYSKGLMFFHMLKNLVGPAGFEKGLQEFYRRHLYEPASFVDIRKAMETQTSERLDGFFDQWLTRKGAPQLELDQAAQKQLADGRFEVKFVLKQIQSGSFYQLKIPVVYELEGPGRMEMREVFMSSPSHQVTEIFPQKVTGLRVDSEFDVFRYLYAQEIPESVSKLFGQNQTTWLVLPSQGALGRASYLEWADLMKENFEGAVEVKWDNEISQIPRGASYFVLGKENGFLTDINSLGRDLGFRVNGSMATIEGSDYLLSNQTVFTVLPSSRDPESSVAWLSAPDVATLLRSAAKIPHYGKYGYLVFQGEQNQLKGEWPVSRSPLNHEF